MSGRREIRTLEPARAERFKERVLIDPCGCWIWQGAISDTGYGCFWTGTNVVGAHRFSYELAHGAIPAGHHIHHECEKPACVNPAHLTTMVAAEHTSMHHPGPTAICGTPSKYRAGCRCGDCREANSDYFKAYRRKGQAFPAISEGLVQSLDVTEKEGFEPSFDPLRLLGRAGSQHEASVPRKKAT